MKAPLRTILKTFLDHVDNLEERKSLGEDQYDAEFQELKKLTDKLKDDPACPCSIGLKDVNRPKNRYKDIVPYDVSRVILPKYEGIPGSDYINASYVKGASGAFAYIAAQGPLPNTVIDFWRMIWVCDVQVVVMACNEKEAGKFKCEAYWPNPGEVKTYGNISIELVNSSQVCSDFLVRTFLVKCESELRDVYQFHYTSWPDHGVPDSVQPILDLVRLMRDCQASETVPIVVHCSAGCGRTGTICAVDIVWACLRHGKLDEDFSLYHIALELRRQRIAMIQTKEQYILAHKAVAAMFEQQLRVIDCHIYENIDEDGEPLMWKEVGKNKEFILSEPNLKLDTKEKTGAQCDLKKTELNDESKSLSNLSPNKPEKNQASHHGTSSNISSIANSLIMKRNESLISSGKNSESSFSRNSILSQQSNDDSIPFIDDDDVCVRPNCGRAYLDIPSCDSISKLVNCFDPFFDKVLGTDDSSPEGDALEISNKMKDFQIASSSKLLDRSSKPLKPLDSKSDIVDCSDKSQKPSLLSNRESYPPCSNNEKFQNRSANDAAGDQVASSLDNAKCAKKVGKATVVRRPSISKLRALFEKSSPRNSGDVSKRLLFRNNSQHVSRAGSAPPSLNCMDKNYATEKESILMMVTRKFRSSSVRSEREMQTKENNKAMNRRSATDTVKDGLNALTRTMSFNISKTFKSYSPSKPKLDTIKHSATSSTSDNIVGTYKPKSPDSQKGNSMWYDKPSLPRAVAIVKPTGKFEPKPDATPPKIPPSPKNKEINKPNEQNVSYISKPAKLKDFFSSLNRKDAKDSLTQWYNAEGDEETEKRISEIPENSNGACTPKYMSKTLPFLPLTSWKKIAYKSPLNSPESPKSISEQPPAQPNSKFYTNVQGTEAPSLPDNLLAEEKSEVHKCPIPEEIIPLTVESNKFWPTNLNLKAEPQNEVYNARENVENECTEAKSLKNQLCDKSEKGNDAFPETKSVKVESVAKPKEGNSILSDAKLLKDECVAKLKEGNNILPDAKLLKEECVAKLKEGNNILPDAKLLKEECVAKPKEGNDIPPAIPKKMVIGKNRNVQNLATDKNAEPLTVLQISDDIGEKSSLVEKETSSDVPEEKSDLYINVNIKAIKNLEQIENTLRKNPRGAIIDLTSRESYSMEEELVNAVHQLSESSVESKSSSENVEKKETLPVKNNSKFPGYEVIWPENSNYPIQKSKSIGKVPLGKSNLTDLVSSHNQTSLCYSPPLRRSINASLALSKSQSCGNLDGLESEDIIKSPTITPTKRLVKEAVVELNTLLNQLTTRTLSEDIEFKSKPKEKVDITETTNAKVEKPKNTDIGADHTGVHSVTLVTKSYNKSGSSPKEEEIVFHFPPPPRGPPPKDDSPVESFNIVCKGGSLALKEVPNDTSKKSEQSNSSSLKSKTEFPQPAPRKSKQSDGLRRSSSYSNISHPSQIKNSRYENIFLEKYQTVSRLQIKPESDVPSILDVSVPIQKSPLLYKSSKQQPSGYVNIADVHTSKISKSNNMKPDTWGSKMSESSKSESVAFNNVESTAPKVISKMTIGESEKDSVYGKIYKISDNKMQTTEKSPRSNAFDDGRRKPVPSKKTERAPLPPPIKHQTDALNEMSIKMSPSISMIPKKLPSRKLEKAPPPPQLLKKSSSAMILQKKNMSSFQQFNTAVAPGADEQQKLPAVHENVPNAVDSSTNSIKIHPKSSVFNDKFVNCGLSHSQSDVSVFLALKERKIQSANQERKLLNLKSILNNRGKQNPELANVSSSDSDSSYERIFLTKEEILSAQKKTEQIEDCLPKSCKKVIPVAPPRSKRRSTMEVDYTQVKAKDASLSVSTSKNLSQESKAKNSRPISNSGDAPPAIPLKTKDAFEIPEHVLTNINKTGEIRGKPVSNFPYD